MYCRRVHFSTDIWGENREEQDPEQAGNGAVLFVYVWLLVSIAALIYVGNSTGNESNKLEGMRWALVGFANVCLTTMVLLVGLEAIEVEGRELEEDGFYGQTSVLLFLTCVFGLIQSVVFIGWTGKRLAAQQQVLPEKSEGYVNVNYERSPSHGFMGVGV
jgi:magnesium-transporting ATPase (P-type)